MTFHSLLRLARIFIFRSYFRTHLFPVTYAQHTVHQHLGLYRTLMQWTQKHHLVK